MGRDHAEKKLRTTERIVLRLGEEKVESKRRIGNSLYQ